MDKKTVAKPAATTADKPANIAPATEFETSGAPLQVTDIDVGHPAVDNDPRANTTELQNRIDFNDPSRDGSDVVTEQLQDDAQK